MSLLPTAFLVSTSIGSRKIRTTKEELEKILSGSISNHWKSSAVGAVTIVKADDGEIITATEALKRGVGGEVLCAAK